MTEFHSNPMPRLVYAWEGQVEKLQAEIDRLRAENAELRGWLEAAINEIDNPLITMHMRAILAKTAKEGE